MRITTPFQQLLASEISRLQSLVTPQLQVSMYGGYNYRYSNIRRKYTLGGKQKRGIFARFLNLRLSM